MNAHDLRAPGLALLGALLLGLTAGRAAETRALGATNAEGTFVPNTMEIQSVSGFTQNSDGEWLFAPIPSLAPGQGFGLQAVAARIFRPSGSDASTPPSVLGLVGLYTEKKSYALGAGYVGHLDDDRWRVVAGGGYVRFNSDYYGVGNSLGGLGFTIPIEQRATLGLGQLMRRLRPGLYAGLRVLAANTTMIVRGPEIPPLHSPEISVNADMYAASPVLQWDTRDNTFAPGKGFLVDARVDIFSGSFHYRSTSLAANHYRTLGGRSVLVLRAYLQMIDGRAPFFALCSFGQGSDLRGYTSGRYRDHAMAAGQAEYRLRLSRRWGLVAFAGLGQVGESLGSLSSNRLLGSVGGGMRFRLTDKNPVNLRCDWAHGRDGGALYIGVGEAF